MGIAGHYSWRSAVVTVADPAADETNILLVAPAGGLRIQKAYAATEAAITGDGTNNITVSLLDGGSDGTGTDSIASAGGASVDWAANGGKELTTLPAELDEGAHLLWKYDEEGTVAPGNVTIIVYWTPGGSE